MTRQNELRMEPMRLVNAIVAVLLGWSLSGAALAALVGPTYSVTLDLSALQGQPLAVAFDFVGGGDSALDNRVDIDNLSFDGRAQEGIVLFGGGALDSRLVVLTGTSYLRFDFFTTTTSEPPEFDSPYVSDLFALSVLSPETWQSLVQTSDPSGTHALMTYEIGYLTGGAQLSTYAGTVDGLAIALSAVPVPLPNGAALFVMGILVLAARFVQRSRVLLAVAASAAVPTYAATPEDVSAWVNVARSGYTYNRSTRTFNQTVKVTPKPKFELQGELKYVVDSIVFNNKGGPVGDADRMVVANANATIGGKSTVVVPLPNGKLSSGSTFSFVIRFRYQRANVVPATPPPAQFVVYARVLSVPIANADFYVAPAQPTPEMLAVLAVSPETGRPILMESNEARLEYDAAQKTPLTAVAGCTGWIAGCVKPGQRTLDQCAKFAPTCATSTPWLEHTACCPSACATDYLVARQSGTSDSEAFFTTYLYKGACFPQFEGIPRPLSYEQPHS